MSPTMNMTNQERVRRMFEHKEADRPIIELFHFRDCL